MWRLGLACGLALTLGWLLVQAAWPGRACALVKTSLALGLGLGLTSMGYVVAISLWRPSRAAAVGADVALLLAASALAWATIRHGPPAALPGLPAGGAAGPLRPWLIAAVGCLGLGAVAIFTLKSLGWPAGDWDAWAIWNLRARFIARGGDHWRDGFSPLLAWSHPDYPLLVPAGVARLWAYTRHETGLAPVALGALFTVATIGLAASAVAVLRGTSQGLVAAVLLLGTPALMLQGAAQYADVPLAFFVLAPLALFCLLDRLPARRAAVGRLAGLTLGLAGCVKNEGLLVVAAVLVARSVTLLWIEGGRAWLREIRSVLAGLAPLLLVTAYQRVWLAPPDALLSSLSLGDVGSRLADCTRYAEVAAAFGRELLRLGGWVGSVVVLLVVYAALVGRRREPQDRAGIAAAGVALALVLGGYAAVFLVTPGPLAWGRENTLPRLLLQLWPACVFLYCLVVETPGRGHRRLDGHG